jgi:hypothetical protein
VSGWTLSIAFLADLLFACSDPELVLWISQVTFNLQKSFTGSSAPQLKLHAPAGLKDIYDVDETKLPTWGDRM